jgi:adenylyltransferase/sulfurtransferase
MPSLRIPTPLRTYAEGQAEVDVQGTTVSEALDDLVLRYPALQQHLFNGHLFNGDDHLRPFVNLFLGEDNVRDLDGLETRLNEDDRLLLIPSIAGGK